ncbi:MAG: hypothetical protein KAW12_12935 [Candidatus Aminicenantes bacterium]|nr:hypothetical protein [Candidatus Aminicenantes bacterium]
MRIFFYEKKCACNKTLIFFAIGVLLFGIYYLDRGIDKHYEYKKKCAEFCSAEKENIEKIKSSIDQGIRGRFIFNFLAAPSQLYGMFYYSATFSSLHSMLDNSGVLFDNSSKIDSSTLGKQSVVKFDFSIFIYIILPFLVSFYGFFYFKNIIIHSRLYLNYSSPSAIIWNFLLSRWVHFFRAMILLTCIVFVWFSLRGISLSFDNIIHVLLFIFVATLVITFIFFIAVLAKIVHSDFLRYILIFVVIPFFVLFIPGELNEAVTNKPIKETKSTYKKDHEKFTIFSDYETMLSNKVNAAETLPEKRRLYKDLNNQYIDQEFKEMSNLEKTMILQADHIVNKIYWINALVPTAFYSTICCELSSMGYSSYLDYYREIFQKQPEIVEGYIRDHKIINFDYLHQTKSGLPRYFLFGVIIAVLYCIAILFVILFFYKRELFPHIKKKFKDIIINGQKGDYILLASEWKDVFDKLLNVCFSKEEFDGKITVDGDSICKKEVFWLPDLSRTDIQNLPIVTGGEKIDKPFSKLSFDEIVKLFPKIKSCDVLILDNIKNHSIKSNKDIFILELNPNLVKTDYTDLYVVYPNKDCTGYEVKLEKKI